MSVLAMFNHALNFLAPALWLALLFPLVARLIYRKQVVALAINRQIALLFVVGTLVLLVGLVVFGRDGKMLTYLALVVAVATVQWVMQRR
jgi:hypothetical protein